MASAFIVDNPGAPSPLPKRARAASDRTTHRRLFRPWSRGRARPELVEDVILGCAFPAGAGLQHARCVVLLRVPQSVGGSTVNRWCDVLEGGVNASLGLDGHRKSLSFLLLAATVRLDAALLARLVDPTSVGPAAE